MKIRDLKSSMFEKIALESTKFGKASATLQNLLHEAKPKLNIIEETASRMLDCARHVGEQ